MTALWRSRRVQAAVSIVLALGLVALFLSRAHLSDIGHAIAQASPAWVLASIAASLSIFLARAWRWTWILRPLGRVPFLPSLRATSIGFAANTVLPARAGEVLRPAILARERGLPFAALFASIVFERVLDALSQLTFLGIALVAQPPGGTGALSSGRIRWLVAAIGGVAIGVALFAVVWRATTERVLERVFRILPGRAQPIAQRIAHTFLDGFASLRTPRLALLVAAGSLGMWGVINVQIYCVMRAFGVDLPITAAFVVTTAGVLGLAVPTPGGVGGYHAAVQYALTGILHVPVATATGVAIVAHAVSFVPISLLGFAFFATSPLQKKGLRTLTAETADAPISDKLSSG